MTGRLQETMQETVSDRFQLARRLCSVKQKVAQSITDEFCLKHPEGTIRYGDRSRQSCTEDACFHMDFLAGAIEADSPEAFADYSQWTARMLGARGIGAHTLEEDFMQLETHLSAELLPDQNAMVLTFLKAGREACSERVPPSDRQPASDSLSLIGKVYLAAILGGQRQAALKIIVDALGSGHSHVDLYVDVFAESLHRVGEFWEMNRISVAQEHIATAITQNVIAAIYPKLVPPAIHRGNMVITGVAGELHQIGGNLVADAMEASGWTVRFLGTNLPPSSVLSSIEEISADVLCISTTMVANLPSVADLVRVVCGKLNGRSPKIVLGGAAYRLATRFAQEVGAAESFTDLRRALGMLCA